MNQQLQDAIKELAVYDGWVREMKATIQGFTPKWVSPDKMFSCWTDEIFFSHQKYTTSADALLPVWRKVRDEVNNIKGTNGPLFYVFNDAMYQVVMDILNNNLPEAVIKLAGIIKQLKQK